MCDDVKEDVSGCHGRRVMVFVCAQSPSFRDVWIYMQEVRKKGLVKHTVDVCGPLFRGVVATFRTVVNLSRKVECTGSHWECTD